MPLWKTGFLRKPDFSWVSGARNLALAAAALAGAQGLMAGPAAALPFDFELGMQPAASPVMADIENFHHFLLWVTIAICILIAGLLLWCIVRYRAKVHPVPSKIHHNTLLETAWTIIPVIILVVIAVPSFRLLYYQETIPKPDVTIEAIGHQWFWSYKYPGTKGFQFDSLGLSDADAATDGKPRLLGVDNPIYVPVNKVIEVDVTGADVIHSWAMPQMGVKMDAVPGRINKTWFKADKTGVFYGECSELCGARHAFMPIELHVVSEAEYQAWLAKAQNEYASLDPVSTRLAAK